VRRGAALAAVLLTVALTSALAVGSAYVSRQFIAGTRVTNGGQLLEPRLESALANALAMWDSTARAAQPIGTTVALADHWLTKLGEDLYFVVCEASRDERPVLRRRSGLLATTYNGRPEPVPGRSFFDLP
jgi:hypothetical protein